MVIANKAYISLLSVHIYSKKKKTGVNFLLDYFFNLKFNNTINIFWKQIKNTFSNRE